MASPHKASVLPPVGWSLDEGHRPIAMLLGNVGHEDDRGGWFGALRWDTGGAIGKIVWRCEHSHPSRREAEQCAAAKWFEHHG